MASIEPVVNMITTDMCDLSIYLRSIKKFGKSTLFRDFIIEKFDDPRKGLLVSVGKEKGAKLLDNVNHVHIDTYKDALELKKYLLEGKGSKHNIKVVAFDTADELVPIFEEEVIRKYNVEERPQKRCTSIKAAYGGYNRGVELAAEMIKDYMADIMDDGFGVWVIAHTKYKNIKQKGDITDGYMQLTSNLPANYEAVFGDIFDVTLTGIIDRNLETEEEEVAGRKVKKNYATDSVRKLYFRGTSLIDAGGRFAFGAVPEFIVFDEPNMAKKFISTIEEGMEKSKTSGISVGKPSKPVKQVVEELVEDIIDDEDEVSVDESLAEELVDEEMDIEDDIDIDDPVEEELDKPEVINKIRSAFKAAEKAVKVSVKDVITREGFSALSEDMSSASLREICELLNIAA